MNNEKVKEENYSKLLDGAIELFKEYGSDKMTIRMVAEKADLSYRCVLRHFETKENLIGQIIQYGSDKLAFSLNKLVKSEAYGNGSGKEQVMNLMSHILHVATKEPKYWLSIEELDASVTRNRHISLEVMHQSGEDIVKKELFRAIDQANSDGSFQNSHSEKMLCYTVLFSVQGLFYRIAKICSDDRILEKVDVEEIIGQYLECVDKCL